MSFAADNASQTWPRLDFADWSDTCATLHLWTQVVGKIRLKLAPMLNHWWQATFYVTARGLTTSPMPYRNLYVQIDFDFVDHQLVMRVSDGREEQFALAPMAVADFYAEVMRRLRALDIDIHIWTMPSEIPNAIPFDRDCQHAVYDADAAQKFWRQLVQADRLLHQFRSSFLGKCSPVHFFWGSFDMAVTRFSGRLAPPMERGAPNVGAWVMREAYSHEVSSCGFWPGNGGFGRAAFYSYAYPEPDGFSTAKVRPDAAYYDQTLKQFILPYEAVRTANNPDQALLDFLPTTYEACANRAGWDRQALERTQLLK
jgi:Family of unknown function (DUF5996)